MAEREYIDSFDLRKQLEFTKAAKEFLLRTALNYVQRVPGHVQQTLGFLLLEETAIMDELKRTEVEDKNAS